MPGFGDVLQALLGRVPQNATQGGVPPAGGNFRPQNAPLGPVSTSAIPGRSYASPGGSSRAESAGYTTSSPGWRQDTPPQIFPPPPPATTGAGPAAIPTPSPRPDRGPQVTGAIGPAATPTPEMIANATTTPSALLQPFNGPVPGNATTSPSALIQDIPYSLLPGAHGQPPAPQSIFNPASMGQPPAPQAVTGAPSGPLPPEIVPAPRDAPAGPAGPSSVRPPKVIHPDNPTAGKLAAGKDRAQTPKRPKRGGQYDLRQQGSRRARK